MGRAFEAARALLDRVKERFDFETLDENPPATSASNETSVVQLADLGGYRVLLTADAGPQGLTEAADCASSLGILQHPHFVQIPHHGSRRNVTPAVLNRWLGTPASDKSERRGYAFVSVGKDADIYPRKKVKNAFIRRGYEVHATRGKTKFVANALSERPWEASIPEEFSEDVED
jgi:beta-lactamase superfamily II metal-dependent hydrolase